MMVDSNTYTDSERSRFKAIENITGISKEYYDTLYEACSKIRDFRDDIRYSFEVQSMLHKAPPQYAENLQEKLGIYFGVDALRSFKGMGIKINPHSKEYYGLFLHTAFIISDNFELPYSSITRHENVIISQMDYFVMLENFSSDLGNTESLILPSILPTVELIQRYKILLYRWASLIAKADSVISEQEEKWLSSLMRQEKPYEEKRPKETVERHTESDLTDKTGTEPPLELLHEMIGLNDVKREIETLYNFVKVQKQREKLGLKTSGISYHCIFTGNAGTGKTTVARIVASIYKELGILKKGHLVETDRSGLVAEYVGQTAIKTNKIIDSALDGVLFIDEAYALADGGREDFGKEAISTLIKRMEDDRDRLVVILAGYRDNMKQFINSNIGLQSRFNRYIEFSDYSADELFEIFLSNAKKYEYILTDSSKDRLREVLTNAVEKKDASFGNGRFVRNLFETVIENQANRLAYEPNITPEILSTIEALDIK